MRNGRPTEYTPELGKLICDKIATGTAGLVKVCRTKGFPQYNIVLRWLYEPDKEEFLQWYLQAREAQADLLSDEVVEIADEAGDKKESGADVARARLRIDARKWKAATLSPKKGGNKLGTARPANETSGIVIKWGEREIPL